MSSSMELIATNNWLCNLCYLKDNTKLIFFQNGGEAIQHFEDNHNISRDKIEFASAHEWLLKNYKEE